MKKTMRLISVILSVLVLLCICVACGGSQIAAAGNTKPKGNTNTSDEVTVEEDGEYTSKDEVALYIHLYGHLPSNYITKKEAQDLGWSGGYLWDYAPGKSIGGSRFGNYEGNLPDAKGRKYFECDIDYSGKKRGAKRIVYSNDGLIYYTEDHYETFEKLYEAEEP
ncbi:MAG: ribonuclease [Lachnospiraceae bacterium]|nr:ribonuclease [Lachnospiraceae bacterium]